MFIGRAKNLAFKLIPGQAGAIQIQPVNFDNRVNIVHTILAELRMEEGGEVIIEDGVDLLVAENPTSCYLMVSGVIRYEV